MKSLMFVILAGLLTWAGPADAQFSFEVSSCLCQIAPDQSDNTSLPDYVYDFGTVAKYHSLFPLSVELQNQCGT